MKSSKIAEIIRRGDLDINVQDLFLSIVIKGLLVNLKNDIKIRNKPVPHFILHTGDDRMFLEAKGYDASIEPMQQSNENNIYDVIPKCIVNPNNIDLDTAQLTAPYSLGSLQYEHSTGELAGLYTLKGEFRRLPMKVNFDLKYYVDSYTDMLELIQYVISNLAFIRTYDIMYMGQKIKCSYEIPDSFGEEHTMDIDGSFQDSREHTLSITVEVETNIPIFNNRTIMPTDRIISSSKHNVIATNTNIIDNE
jgi:hypothetical protein